MTPELLTAGLGAGVAAIGLLAAGWRFAKAAHRAANRIERIERLASELAPNHGSSVKDTVHRIEMKVDGNTSAIDSNSERIAKAEGAIEALALVQHPAKPVIVPVEKAE